MSNNLFWQTESDGVVYATPEGFTTSYYIYPPNYDEGFSTNKYEMWITKDTGNNDEVYHFNTLEEAKEYAIAQFKLVMEPLLYILFKNCLSNIEYIPRTIMRHRNHI
ncbi:MAG: hypothetical protein QG673_1012 [Pseudomonadota bacterium]|nr:hypothetical protein [Pseudomonadota bacterium]